MTIGYRCIQGYPNRVCSGCTTACNEPVAGGDLDGLLADYRRWEAERQELNRREEAGDIPHAGAWEASDDWGVELLRAIAARLVPCAHVYCGEAAVKDGVCADRHGAPDLDGDT